MEKNQKLVSLRVRMTTAEYEAIKKATLVASVAANQRLTEGDYLLSLFKAASKKEGK